MRGRETNSLEQSLFTQLTDRIYELKKKLEAAKYTGLRFYHARVYDHAREEFERMKEIATSLSSRYLVKREEFAFADMYLRLCDEQSMKAQLQSPKVMKLQDKKIGYETLLREVFDKIYTAAKNYRRDDVTINVHIDVQKKLPENLRGRTKWIYKILKKLPLEEDETWPHIFHGRKSDLTRYGRMHGLL